MLQADGKMTKIMMQNQALALQQAGGGGVPDYLVRIFFKESLK